MKREMRREMRMERRSGGLEWANISWMEVGWVMECADSLEFRVSRRSRNVGDHTGFVLDLVFHGMQDTLLDLVKKQDRLAQNLTIA